jgi:gliding motility-associated-like protein
MKKILLLFVCLLVLADISVAQRNIAVSNFFAGNSGCNLSASRNVSVGLENVSLTDDLSNIPFNLSYTINGGAAATDLGITVANLGPGQTFTYTFTIPANLSTPGAYNFVCYVSGLTGDADQTNDTTFTTVTNNNSVGGIVSANDTVCEGVNSGTLTLSGHTGAVQFWQSSLDGISWSNIGNGGSTTLNYSNLSDTTYYRARVKNGACAIDSSSNGIITVTPIPYLTSNLFTGTCTGGGFNYVPTSTVPGSTYTWSRDSVYHITPDSSSGIGNINETLFNDTTRYIYTYYNIVTTANGCSNSGETINVRVDIAIPSPASLISGTAGTDSVCQNTSNFTYSTTPSSLSFTDTVAWYTWSYDGLGANEAPSFPLDPTPFTSWLSTGIYFSSTATSGNLFVQASNYCGSGIASPPFPIDVDTAAFAIAAGPDSTCQSFTPTPILLSGASVGGPAGIGGTWSVVLGSGTFNDSISTTMPDTVQFTPTPGFVGPIILRLTTDEPPGVCGATFTDRLIRVDTAAIAISGGPDNACQAAIPAAIPLNGASVGGPFGTDVSWSIFLGGGSLSYTGPTTMPDTVTYTPAPNFAGVVTLQLITSDPGTPCGPVIATRIINIDSFVVVTAGVDTTICAGSSYTLAGTRGGGATASTWTTTGDGTFNDSSLVNAIYTPGVADTTNGTVILIITTDDPAGACSFAIDSMTMTIEPQPLVSAGADDSICAGSNYTLMGSYGGSTTSITWTTSGDGTFSDSSQVAATYTPGINDTTNGSVYLIITTNDPAGICTAVVDTMLLTITTPAIVSAGSDTSVCFGSTYTLAGTIAGSTVSITWTSAGDGVFSDSSLVNAIYTPGATDLVNGSVILVITTNDPIGPCNVVVDSMLLTIDTLPIVNAGLDNVICSGSSYTLSGLIGGSATSATWTTLGDGSFNTATLLNAVYTPGANDITNGTVNLVLTTNDPNGACTAITDTVELTVSAPPTILVTDPAAVCQPLTVDISAPAVTVGSSPGLTFNYYTNAAATIHVVDSSAITATGTYYIVGSTGLGCRDTAAVNVIVNLAAVGGIASNDALVCSGNNADTIFLTNYVGAIQQWQSSTDGGMNWMNIANATDQLAYSNITVTTWYRAMLSATCASAVSEEARITVDPNALSVGGTLSANDTVCSGNNSGTITLTGYLGTVLRWEYTTDGGNTWVYINNTDTIHNYSNIAITTVFRAVVQNSVCGAAYSSNDTITTTLSSDAGFVVGATPGCPNVTSGILTLSGHAGSVLGWQYSLDGGNNWNDTLITTDSLQYSNLSDTIFYRAVVQALGCFVDTSSAAAVVVYPSPFASFTADTVCLGSTTNFTNNSTVAAGFIQFNQWDFGDNNTSLAPASAHVYPALGVYSASLIAISNFGCTDTAIVNVTVDTLPNVQITASSSLAFCCGGSVTLTAPSGYTYLWAGSLATTQSIDVNNCAASGTYQVTVTDTVGGCSNTSSVAVVIFPLPNINAGNDTTISKGGSLLLNAQGGIVYSWLPVTDLSNSGLANPVAAPQTTTSYTLTGTDNNGCVNADTIVITVLADINNIIVTNLLTTNGDGYNDYWIISDLESYPGTEVIVINREGQQVYYSSYYDNSWDGTNKNGKMVPDGTYYYFIKFPNSDKVYKGPITILNEK